MSVVFEPQPIPDFKSFVENLVGKKGYGFNSCPDHCPDRGEQHAHLSYPENGGDFIVWADGRYSGYDLTPPARLIYAPVPLNLHGGVLAYDMVLPKWPGDSGYWTPLRNRIPRPGGCYRADAGFMVHIQPGCRCPR